MQGNYKSANIQSDSFNHIFSTHKEITPISVRICTTLRAQKTLIIKIAIIIAITNDYDNDDDIANILSGRRIVRVRVILTKRRLHGHNLSATRLTVLRTKPSIYMTSAPRSIYNPGLFPVTLTGKTGAAHPTAVTMATVPYIKSTSGTSLPPHLIRVSYQWTTTL